MEQMSGSCVLSAIYDIFNPVKYVVAEVGDWLAY